MRYGYLKSSAVSTRIVQDVSDRRPILGAHCDTRDTQLVCGAPSSRPLFAIGPDSGTSRFHKVEQGSSLAYAAGGGASGHRTEAAEMAEGSGSC